MNATNNTYICYFPAHLMMFKTISSLSWVLWSGEYLSSTNSNVRAACRDNALTLAFVSAAIEGRHIGSVASLVRAAKLKHRQILEDHGLRIHRAG